ncbi:MAG: HEAT repeat domain-containing protein [Spirochaetaceae bacterium]
MIVFSIRKIFFLLLLILLPLSVTAQEESGDKNSSEGSEKEEEESEKDDEEEEERQQSLREEREQTLTYGIDSQVLGLISSLEEEENTRYNDKLAEVFDSTPNNSIRKAIVDFYRTVEEDMLVDEVKGILSDEWVELDTKIAVSYIKYLKKHQDEEISDLFLEISESPTREVALEAIKALGGAERKEYVEELKTIYEQAETRPRKAAAMDALGEIKSEESVPLFSRVALDEDEESGLRWKAVTALGNIGTDEALETILKAMGEQDARLREYAVEALSKFPESKEITRALIQAMRDDNWRVRVEGARSLGKLNSKEGVDILTFKAEHDPDTRNVRTAAVRALGEIDDDEAHEFLLELYKSSKTPAEIRGTAIEVLVEHNLPESIDTIEAVLVEEWENEDSKILDYTCKQLSTAKHKALEPLFARMLTHPERINLIIYGLRGIRLNGFSSLSGEVEKLTEKNTARSVKQLALSVLEEL